MKTANADAKKGKNANARAAKIASADAKVTKNVTAKKVTAKKVTAKKGKKAVAVVRTRMQKKVTMTVLTKNSITTASKF